MTILILAAILDYLIGDPWGWIHPVQVMGGIISLFSNFVLGITQNKWWRRFAGIILGTSLIGGSAITTWLIIDWVTNINHWLGITIQVILLASCFAGRSLNKAGQDVLQPLKKGDIETARTRLSFYVGRDTDNLSPPEIFRAILETVAENSVDGVTAPLFFAILGTLIPHLGAVPMTIAYKASSTLDSMVGYQKEPFTDLGWFSAKLEDYLTLIPCRLTVLTLALISGKPKQVIKDCWTDAVKDSSPNSGWSECAYASILEIQLGGANSYQGQVKIKPLLGKPIYKITAEKIYEALQLTRISFLIWLSLGLLINYSFKLLVLP